MRSIANGNETVPTVVVAGTYGMVNPSAKQVKRAAEEHAPHVLR